jgi:hypothetical protein
MSGIFGGGSNKAAEAAAAEARAMSRRQQQDAGEREIEARQKAERGGVQSGRGRNMLVGRTNLPKNLGGVS